LKNAIALDISVSQARWTLINETLKTVAKSHKRGAAILIDDPLTAKLWQLVKRIDLQHESGALTKESAKEAINEILYHDVIEEQERQAERQAEVERREAESQRMTLRQWIVEFIRQCEDGERLKRRSTKRITPGTIKSYKGTLAQLDAYTESSHKIIDFDDVTIDFYDAWKRYFIKKQYSPNTIGRHVKNLKSFMFAAEDMKLTTRQDYKSERFSVDHEDVDNVYLTEERIQQMYDFDPMDEKQIAKCIARLPEKDRKRLKELTDRWQSRNALSECKDVFIVGCLTGQRVSDYKRINSDMIVQLKDGRDYISLRQEKTGKYIYIPIDERVTAVLNKYGGKLPKVFDQKINMHIKTVGHLLGWTEKAGITELHGTMAVDKGKKFYECIKTHTARRTFATNAYKNGIALSSIMAITGHSSEAMLRKYLKLDNKERAMLAALDFEKVRKAQ
jgi:integrase